MSILVGNGKAGGENLQAIVQGCFLGSEFVIFDADPDEACCLRDDPKKECGPSALLLSPPLPIKKSAVDDDHGNGYRSCHNSVFIGEEYGGGTYE